MSDTLHALITNNTVDNVIVADTATTDGAAVLAALADTYTVVDLTTVSPQPGVGWAYNGTTFTAPAAPAPTARQTAKAEVQTLAASIPGHITQAQADAATIAAMTAGQAPTAAQIAALTNHANGWVTILEALGTLVAAIGVTP